MSRIANCLPSHRRRTPALLRFLATVRLWRRRARERRMLAGLSHDQLKDMGLSRADAVGESLKPFWRE